MARLKNLPYREYFRYAFATTLIGVLAGLVTSLFGQGILYVTHLRQDFFPYLLYFLPLAGLAIKWAYQVWGGQAARGMGLVFDVGQRKSRKIPKRLIPFAIVSTWVSHLFGASVGREGVAVQLGASLGNLVHRILAFERASRVFLIIGMAAGFAGLFQTPWAGTLFAMEVLIVGRIEWKAFLPALIAAQIASWVSKHTGLESFQVPIKESMGYSFSHVLSLVALAFFFLLIGKTFAYCLKKGKALMPSWIQGSSWRYLLLASMLMGLLVLTQSRYSGLGSNLIQLSFQPETGIGPRDWLFKLLLTVFSLSLGYQGGEVTPMFAMGAAGGAFLAPLLSFPPLLGAALGYIGVFGAATNTRFAAIIMGMEVFGWTNLPAYILLILLISAFSSLGSIYSQQEVVRGTFFSLH